MKNSTKSKSNGKAIGKPYPDFPLFPHARGYWCKKHKQRLRYFSKLVDDPDGSESLREWNRCRPYWEIGMEPPGEGDEGQLTLESLCNQWLASKQRKLECGKLRQVTFMSYKSTAQYLCDQIGKHRAVDSLCPDDFSKLWAKMNRKWTVHVLNVQMTSIGGIFKWGFEMQKCKRVCFGPDWQRPDKRARNEARNAKGPQMFSREEALAILEHSDLTFRAMFLLAMNTGLGNMDLVEMPVKALNLDKGWLDYPRRKNANPRRVPLWKETVEALQTVLARRPAAVKREDRDLVFLTPRGHAFRDGPRDLIWRHFAKTAKRAGVVGRNFYDARRTFASVALEARDQEAVRQCMGHSAPRGDMLASVYQQVAVCDARLQAVVDFVHDWLFPPE